MKPNFASGIRPTTIGALLAAEGGHIKTGPFGTVLKAREYTATGVPLISVGEIGYGVFRLHAKTPRISPAVTSRLSEFLLQEGDIVFGRKGAVDRSARVSTDQVGWFLGSDGIRLRLPATTNSRFIAYQLQAASCRKWILQHATGTTMASLNQDVIERIPIVLPPLLQQCAIAEVLRAFDDKIELNRRMNETLEATARALFKSWFIDFDPVRAKGKGRYPNGIDAETAALFPSEVVDSELGSIPRGWKHDTVNDVCVGLFDGPHATPPETSSGAIFLGIRNFKPTSLDLTDVRFIAEADFPKWTKRVIPTAGDIVFTYEATLGFFALIPPGVRCCLGRRTALVRPRESNGHFLFHWFVAAPFQEHLRAHRQPGSTVDRIWLKDFPDYPVLAPPVPLVARFEARVRAIWARFHTTALESSVLREARDALLPRLLSGDLRVRDAERVVSDVT